MANPAVARCNFMCGGVTGIGVDPSVCLTAVAPRGHKICRVSGPGLGVTGAKAGDNVIVSWQAAVQNGSYFMVPGCLQTIMLTRTFAFHRHIDDADKQSAGKDDHLRVACAQF